MWHGQQYVSRRAVSYASSFSSRRATTVLHQGDPRSGKIGVDRKYYGAPLRSPPPGGIATFGTCPAYHIIQGSAAIRGEERSAAGPIPAAVCDLIQLANALDPRPDAHFLA